MLWRQSSLTFLFCFFISLVSALVVVPGRTNTNSNPIASTTWQPPFHLRRSPTFASSSSSFVRIPRWVPSTQQCSSFSPLFSTSRQQQSSVSSQKLEEQQKRRRTLLTRRGPYFALDRMRGSVEFGSTLELVTTLSGQPNYSQIASWLTDERGLALSIWDESLITELGNSVYRLQLMTLQFVTLQLSPTVDIRMWTSMMSLPSKNPNGNKNNNTNNNMDGINGQNSSSIPVFSLQSIGFDPRLQLLPGLGVVSADMLGIDIVVVGEMRPTMDGRGVQGRISFATTGNLPPPLLFIPDAVLQAAANSISDTVAQFAVRSFQRGAIQQYRAFCKKQPMPMQPPPPNQT